jgi:predicted RNA-binding Zn ribbon-like protein
MDFSHYSDDPVQVAVDLVNTLNTVSGDEQLNSPTDVTAFIQSRDADWCEPGWEATQSDLDRVVALRSRLRAIFEAQDESEAADIINNVLSEADAVPRLSLHGDVPHLHFESDDDSPARWLGAVTAMGLTVALIEGGFERFGRCSSSTCDDVFVDGSRNRSRRHCSDTCTTRDNVAAHRARQREATEAPSTN